MTGRLALDGLRTARPFIRPPRTALPLPGLSRKHRSSENGSLHRPAPASPCLSFARTGPRRRYSSTSGPHGTDLVLSDAQRRTIYALSTPPGKAGVAVVRISGPDALRVWRAMVKTRGEGKGKARERDPEPWKMHRCSVVHPESGEALDDGLAVFFKGALCVRSAVANVCSVVSAPLVGPKSFTTEDVLELHVHSGRAIISSVLNAISFLPFCRPAEHGEFTRRAFEGGRLDLTQVEGLRDLIDAETETQRKLALRSAEVSIPNVYAWIPRRSGEFLRGQLERASRNFVPKRSSVWL